MKQPPVLVKCIRCHHVIDADDAEMCPECFGSLCVECYKRYGDCGGHDKRADKGKAGKVLMVDGESFTLGPDGVVRK